MKLRILVSVFLVGVIFLQSGFVHANHPGAKFVDLEDDDPYYSIIMSLWSMGIVMGDENGYINGDKTLNRAELVVIVARASKIELKSSDKNCFPDIKEEWFAGAVCAMVRLNLINGYPDGLFRPGREVTAGESAKIILNALSTHHFSDLQKAIEFLENNRLTLISLRRDDPITRNEAFARLLHVDTMPLEQMDSEGNPFNPATDTIMVVEEGGPVFYMDYNQTQLERHLGVDPIILFFHASWCPLCRSTEERILDELENLKGGAVIFKINYDTEIALKKEYGITYQDALVPIKASGQVLKTLSGYKESSDLQALIDSLFE
jgi:thiol-disulfide isomerase/thioredoxin